MPRSRHTGPTPLREVSSSPQPTQARRLPGELVLVVLALALVVPGGLLVPTAVRAQTRAGSGSAPSASPQGSARDPVTAGALPSGQSTAAVSSAPSPASKVGGQNPPAPQRASLPPLPAEAAGRKAWLKARLDEVLAEPGLAAAKVAALISEFESGQVLYARNEKLALNAASNVKLVTSAAALARLGPEYRWRTVVFAPAKTGGRWLGPGGELQGDLYLRGSGDPTLSTEALGELAGTLAALGLKRVRGALVVDASFFGGPAVGPAYDQKTESAAFRSPSSAASLNGNAVSVTIIPAPVPGAPARVVVDPASPYFTVTGRVVTASSGPAVPLVETAQAGNQTRISVSGRIRLGTLPRTFVRRIVHPELYLGHSFVQVMRKRGISVEKPLRLEALPDEGYRALVTHSSPPLAVVVHDLNKRSSNFAAEQVLRTLGAEVVGRPGTWEKGLEAVGRYLESLGIPRNAYRMVNGAGLYDSNRFSAEQLTTVMRSALRDFRIASEFLSSLAVAGADGTLGQRMGGTAAQRFVRAKTGTLATVSTLSGVAGAPGQKPLLFSILFNDVPNPLHARAAQDRMAELLVLYLDPTATTASMAPAP
jgi:serine-type D-Ala-D-Ala carboxypeptidase/endopeptidase (penicillin-binding protein 4)